MHVTMPISERVSVRGRSACRPVIHLLYSPVRFATSTYKSLCGAAARYWVGEVLGVIVSLFPCDLTSRT